MAILRVLFRVCATAKSTSWNIKGYEYFEPSAMSGHFDPITLQCCGGRNNAPLVAISNNGPCVEEKYN